MTEARSVQDGDRLLQAILDRPDDDAVRLVYADWLDDHGDADRAEFIRLQLSSGSDVYLAGDIWMCPSDGREAELLRAGAASWMGGVPLDQPGLFGASWLWRRGFLAEVECSLTFWAMRGRAVCARHPVERVIATDSSVSPPGDEGRQFFWAPPDSPGDSRLPTVPWPIFTLLTDSDSDDRRPNRIRWYDSHAGALAALSRACVAFGRSAPAPPRRVR